MNSPWRLIKSGYSDGFTNMAIDEALCAGYCQGITPPTLRLYGFRPAAFSLGYFQNAHRVLDLNKCIRENIDIVRRLTGGGALFHHQELTYSIVCAKEDLAMCDSVVSSFRKICLFLLEAYTTLGLDPEFAVESERGFIRKSLGAPCGFCPASKEKYDILINGKKIGGNAQKRYRDVIFQHGSIPLGIDEKRALAFLIQSPADIEQGVITLTQALGRAIAYEELARTLARSFEATFALSLREGTLNAQERSLAQRLKIKKYSKDGWNLYRDYGCCSEKAPVA